MRILLSLVLSLFLSSTSFAAVNQVCEEDGSPCFFPWKLKFTNGTLSDNLNGTGSVVTGAGVYTGVLVGDGASTSGVTSSAGIASAIGDETGSGAMVFGTSPKFTTSITSAIVYGSEADNGDLTIHGTSSATRTTSDVLIQPTAGKVGIGNSAPDSTLHVTGSFKVEGTGSGTLAIGNGATSGGILQINEDTDAGSNNATFTVPSLAADTDYTLPADDGDAGEQLQTDGSGVLTWEAAGSGSGAKVIQLNPYSAKLSGAYVTATITNLDAATQGAQIDAGDGNWRLLFDASTDEAAVFYAIIPDNYASAPVLKIIYSMVSATANEVEWEGAIQCVTPGDAADIATASFAAGATATETVPGTAGHTDSLVSISVTDDSCAAGDLLYVYISTDADDATNDDATGDRELVAAYVTYS